MSENALHTLADAMGILPVFHDLSGTAHWTNDETRRAMLKAMRIDAATDKEARASLGLLHAETAHRLLPREVVTRVGDVARLTPKRPCDWHLTDEDGRIVAEGRARDILRLPALTSGLYGLHAKSRGTEETMVLLVAPARVPTVQTRIGMDTSWGLTAALYGLRSSRNQGIGDYADLADLANGLAPTGCGFLGINPIHNLGWSSPEVISPYSPSHRGFLNTRHIAADRIPGLEDNTALSRLAASLQDMGQRQGAAIDYAAVTLAQSQVFPDLYALFRAEAADSAKSAFEAYLHSASDHAQRFADYEVLASRFGGDWRLWDPEIRDLKAPRASDSEARAFHLWLQWVAQTQLDEAANRSGLPLGLYLDLAVGPRLDGAEAWLNQSCMAQGVALGAPPDHLSPEGQNWQLAAYAPNLAANEAYQGFRTVLRQTMRGAGILRIDHILGLNRMYWLPLDGTPGAYVRQPFDTLLALVAIEADRANCVIIGEDLGLVPDGFRDRLAQSGVYGYSVMQYEMDETGSPRPASALRPHSLACFSTHDTPTVEGYRTGRDIDWWQRLGWIDAPKAAQLRDERKPRARAFFPPDQSPQAAATQRLARAPVALAAVQLDDLMGEVEAQNLPGTIDEHPNWRRRAPMDVAEITTSSALAETAEIMRLAGRSRGGPDGRTGCGDKNCPDAPE